MYVQSHKDEGRGRITYTVPLTGATIKISQYDPIIIYDTTWCVRGPYSKLEGGG